MQGVLLAQRFRIGERVGSGGMGEVWSAQDERMRREVAVKLVHVLGGGEGGTQARFQREVQLAGRLSHQNIVTVHDWGEELLHGRRTLYVVMELVPGVSLRRRLEEPRSAPWPVAVGWARQIAQALHVAHSRGVIHRDIKPANVLLTPEDTIKVLDFGVAKFVGETLSVHELTATGAPIGSPLYMSPEQAEGERDIDHRSDLYSLGCLLYHAVTGEPPFIAPSPLAILRMQVSKTPEAPSDRYPDLPRSLSNLIMSLLAKRPEHRPADAGAVHAALSTLLVDHVVTLPSENPLDIVQLGNADPLAGRILERAWQIWQSTERHSTSMREQADRLRGEAEQLLQHAHAEAERLLNSASTQAQESESERLTRTAKEQVARLVREAAADAEFMKSEAEQVVADARVEAEALLAEAREKGRTVAAERTGGEAELIRTEAEAESQADTMLTAARTEAERLITEATVEGNSIVEKARMDADQLLVVARRDATQIRDRTEELRERMTAEIEELHEHARHESAEAMKSAGERCDALVKAAEEQLSDAQAKAKEVLKDADSEAGKVRIAAVRKAENLLKEAEQRKAELSREADEIKAGAAQETTAVIEKEQRELDMLVGRREDSNAEMPGVRDVVEALASFEDPPTGGNH